MEAGSWKPEAVVVVESQAKAAAAKVHAVGPRRQERRRKEGRCAMQTESKAKARQARVNWYVPDV